MTTWVPIGEDPQTTGLFDTLTGSVVAGNPGKLDVKLVSGADNSFDIDFQGISLTGLTFAAPIVAEITGVVVVSFTVTPITGGLRISLTKALTDSLLVYPELHWDLDVTDVSLVPKTWLTGSVSFIHTAN